MRGDIWLLSVFTIQLDDPAWILNMYTRSPVSPRHYNSRISSVDGLCTSGSSAWLKSGWSSSFHTLEGLAGVTALGYGSALAGVQERQFSAWRFADFALVGAGVPRQSAAVLNSLHHFVYLSKTNHYSL